MRLLVISVLLLVMGVAPNVLAEGQIDSKDRLMELQDKRSVSILPQDRAVVSEQCINNKQTIKTLQTATDESAKKRIATYGAIQKEIKAIELRMSKQGADASEVDLLIGKLQQSLDTFTEKSRYSQQLAEDITAVDCVNSPELYKAGIAEYNQTRQEMFTLASELKVTVLLSPQTTFNPLINRLRI
ncbi:hypothetical protein H6795_04025 [Candidatus Nomurabacteria bacterium]|nr:hypothetical protein [Candidatus Nomurabacteria bacterium]